MPATVMTPRARPAWLDDDLAAPEEDRLLAVVEAALGRSDAELGFRSGVQKDQLSLLQTIEKLAEKVT